VDEANDLEKARLAAYSEQAATHVAGGHPFTCFIAKPQGW
jgi:hypothetical protein